MTPQASALALKGESAPAVAGAAAKVRPLKIILIRHGKPAIPTAPVARHHEFRTYIDAYEEAGLDPADAPPAELRDLVRELDAVFTSGRKRAADSAKALAPNAELIVDPLFAESPLASPRIPLLKMKVTKWAVISRLMWYAGFSPKIEGYRKSKRRAKQAAEILIERAQTTGGAVLVAHGYFNYLIGIELRRHGFAQTGRHKAKYWNDVVYER
ncbi:MAG: histidine phosphatase family protein [Proteobacteria bacterium]|nr:histidine phosphatase family protein [Pseudomonadota bacterium]